MVRLRFQFILMTPLVVAIAWALPLQAQNLPKGADLMDKYVQATGGKEAHEKVKSVVARGTMEVQGIKGDLTMYQKAPNLMFMEIKLPGIGTVATGYDGKVAWENNPITGAKIFKGNKMEEMIRDASLNSDVNWRQFYKDAKTVEEVNINGKPAYRVDLTSKGGDVSSRYFDKASGLIVKMKAKLETDMGNVEVESTVSDYKKFNGILMPTKIRQSILGSQVEMTLKSVEQNVNIPQDRFALPKDVKDLLKKT